MKLRIPLTILSLFLALAAKAQSGNIDMKCDTSKFKFLAVAEIGFNSVLAHHIQLGQNGTYFDYVKDGGQDVLFPIFRFSLEMDVNKRNTFILLYQPLRIESQAFLRTDAVFNQAHLKRHPEMESFMLSSDCALIMVIARSYQVVYGIDDIRWITAEDLDAI